MNLREKRKLPKSKHVFNYFLALYCTELNCTDLKDGVIPPLYDLVKLGKEHDQHNATKDGENASKNLNT